MVKDILLKNNGENFFYILLILKVYCILFLIDNNIHKILNFNLWKKNKINVFLKNIYARYLNENIFSIIGELNF